MKKYIKGIFTLFCIAAILTACKEDEIDVNNSIFDKAQELTGFDKWLDENFRLTYNIRFKYKYEDMESNMNYNLIPAQMEKASIMAQFVKFLWLDAYTEVIGLDFIRQHAPRMIALVGSAAWKNATKMVGSADGGLKVTLYNINEFELTNIDKLNEKYFKTLHHEFAHILHEKKMFELRYGDLSSSMYVGSSWSNYSDAQAAAGGLVSPYAGMDIYEDFVEVIAYYITYSDEWWADWYTLAGEEGAAIIKDKVAFVKDYMKVTWDIDLDKLRSVVRRRMQEAATLELKTEF